MLRSVGDLDQYKYSINDIIISKKGSNDQLIIKSDFIKSLTIVNKYDENIMPIVQVIASVTKDVYKALTVDEADLRALVIMYKNIVNTDVKARELVFNKTFAIRNEYDFQPEEFRTLLNEKDDEGTIDASNPNALVDASFYLLDIANIEKYRKLYSLATNTSLVNALAAVFAQRGFTSVLMNDPHGYSGNIVTPMGNLLATLDCLNKNYGIFNTPYTFYMGLNHIYLLERVNMGRAVEVDTPSHVSLFLEADGSAEQSDVGCTKENDAFIINMTEAPKVVKLDNYAELVDGSYIVSIDSNQDIMHVAGGSDNPLRKPVVVQHHKLANQLRYSSMETKSALMVNLIDVDYEAIGPNLAYKVTVHKDYEALNPVNGPYRLAASTINITKATDNEFSLTASLVLKKSVW